LTFELVRFESESSTNMARPTRGFDEVDEDAALVMGVAGSPAVVVVVAGMAVVAEIVATTVGLVEVAITEVEDAAEMDGLVEEAGGILWLTPPLSKRKLMLYAVGSSLRIRHEILSKTSEQAQNRLRILTVQSRKLSRFE